MIFHSVLRLPLRVFAPSTINVGSPRTLKRVTEVWVPELQRLGVKVPLLLVGCKSDLRPQDQNMQQVRLALTTPYSIPLLSECRANLAQAQLFLNAANAHMPSL